MKGNIAVEPETNELNMNSKKQAGETVSTSKGVLVQSFHLASRLRIVPEKKKVSV